MALVYPQSERLAAAIGPFNYDADLRLFVIPFDLIGDRLVGSAPLGLPLR